MKAATFLAITFCFLAGNVHSQAPETSGTLLGSLQAIDAANKALLDSQQKTLDGLDQLQQNAKQLRFFGGRG